MDLAEVLKLAERCGQAAEPVREGISLYGQKEDLLAAASVRDVLAELEA